MPFFFVYYPALLFQGPWTEIVRAVVTGTVGVIALAAGLEGYFSAATWPERALFMAAALLLIDPGWSPTSSAWPCSCSAWARRSSGRRTWP